MSTKKEFRHRAFIVVGIVMTLAVLTKLLLHVDIDSDWFWLMAALGLTVEGIINLNAQMRFENKYCVISLDEYANYEKFKKLKNKVNKKK